MSRNEERRFLVLEAEATRDYGTTVLKAARHRHYASKEITAAALADELGERPDVEVLAREAIAEVGATSAKDTGAVMKALMPRVKGQADGKLVNEVVRDLLK